MTKKLLITLAFVLPGLTGTHAGDCDFEVDGLYYILMYKETLSIRKTDREVEKGKNGVRCLRELSGLTLPRRRACR
jgi:hypothetical protein